MHRQVNMKVNQDPVLITVSIFDDEKSENVASKSGDILFDFEMSQRHAFSTTITKLD